MDDPLLLDGLDRMAHEGSVKEAPKKTKEPSVAELKEKRLAEKEVRLKEQQVKAPKAPPPKPEPPPPPAEMPPEFKSHLLDKIAMYRERFPGLKKRNGNVTAKNSGDEILDELHFIEMQLGSKSGEGGSGMMVLTAATTALEWGTKNLYNPLGLNLAGLSQVTHDNRDKFEPIMDELMIKYGTSFYLSAETRLLLAMGGLVATVHAANVGNPLIGQALQRANETFNPSEKAKDL